MQYVPTSPMIITSRLMPGIKIGDATISIEPTHVDTDGRTVYEYYIDRLPDGGTYHAKDLRSGVGAGVNRDMREITSTLLSFLLAEADAYRSTMGAREPEDGWMFNAAVAEWAYVDSDEIQMAQDELMGDNA